MKCLLKIISFFYLLINFSCKSSAIKLTLYPSDTSKSCSYDLDTWQNKKKSEVPKKKLFYDNKPNGAIIVYPFDIPFEIVKEASLLSKMVVIVSSKLEQEKANKILLDSSINITNIVFIVSGQKFNDIATIPIYTIVDSFNKYQFMPKLQSGVNKKIFKKVLSVINSPFYLKKIKTKSFFPPHSIVFYNKNLAFIDLKTFNVNKSLGTLDNFKNDLINNLGIKELVFIPGVPGNMTLSSVLKILENNRILIKEPIIKNADYLKIELITKSITKSGFYTGHKIQIERIKEDLSNAKETAYMNVVIIRNKIFVPQYGISEDINALNTWRNLMPNYTIIGCEIKKGISDIFNERILWDNKIKIY